MIRLGSIDFINSLPVDLGLRSGAVPIEAEIVRGTPAELNQKILTKKLEISPVSALWYAEHQRDFLLLPDLSISSESGVQSVLLFSCYPLSDLKGKKIAVTGKGRTTPALLEIICRLRYGFEPYFVSGAAGDGGIPDGCGAMLLIGDEALIANERLKNASLNVIDLAEEWREWTKYPLVFAVWVARRDVFLTQAGLVLETHRALLRSKTWGLSHFEEVLLQSEKQASLPRAVLKSYFSRLSYGLDENLKQGMSLYFQYAIQCGLLKSIGEFEEIGNEIGSQQAVGCQ